MFVVERMVLQHFSAVGDALDKRGWLHDSQFVTAPLTYSQRLWPHSRC
jgi:hypothetical protein